jgi:prepilin-type N-terminal cleavage/methylation domain-containing protein
MIAFTLIELLIVVAIIAILAAIAVPNFLEAQTRAKASRVKADLRTVATALEAYNVDNNDYPMNDGYFNILPIQITTPIAYLSSSLLIDPFTEKETDPNYGDLEKYYTYNRIVRLDEALRLMTTIPGYIMTLEAVDDPIGNNGAFQKYGQWRILSLGPDRIYGDTAAFPADFPMYGSDISYDPTNGTNSWGNIIRTQKSTEGVLQRVNP